MFPIATNFTEQPLYRPVLNWGNPLTRGLLVSLYNCATDANERPRNYVDGKSGTCGVVTRGVPAVVVAGPGTWLVSPQNVSEGSSGSGPRNKINGSATFNGSTSWAQLPLDLAAYRQVTIAFWYRRTSAADTVNIEYGANFNPNGFIIDPQSGGSMIYAIHDGTVQRTAFLLTQIPIDEWHHHVIAPDRDVANGLGYWLIDGISANFAYSGVPITPGINFVANGNLNIGARNGGAGAFGAMEVAGLHLWNRHLRVDEVKMVYRDGWQMFQPLRRSWYATGLGSAPPSTDQSRYFLAS